MTDSPEEFPFQPRFQILVDIDPNTSFDDFSVHAYDENNVNVTLVFNDLIRSAFYFEDPNAPKRTIVKIGEDKFSVAMDLQKFCDLIDKLMKHQLFSTISLN